MLTQKNTTNILDEIITYLTSNNIINECDSQKIVDIVKFFDSKHLFKYYDENSMEKLYQITTTEPDLVPRHDGYPIPDPVKGRPHIGWLECRHDGCNLIFPSGEMLINHLKSFKKYIPNMHKHHEYIVNKMKLTPDKIINNKMTKCPSYTCSNAHYIFTPDELCQHFKLLGIQPFWSPSQIDQLPEKPNKSFIQLQLSKKIYTTDKCILCLDKEPQVVFYPCCHHIYCFNCITITNCPLCRQKIIDIFPF